MVRDALARTCMRGANSHVTVAAGSQCPLSSRVDAPELDGTAKTCTGLTDWRAFS